MITLLENAFFWTKQHIAVIPIQYQDKRPEGKWETYQTLLPDTEQLKTWFPDRLHNLGVVVGWRGLVVIDFDNLTSYARWLLWTNASGGIARRVAEDTYQVRTGRGMHIYVRLPFKEQNRKMQGVDIKANGGYVLAPPSIHPSGRVYQAINPKASIFMISALSDILPTELLATNTEIPATITPPVFQMKEDPWEHINSIGEPGQDLVTKIRSSYKIEDFFSDTEYTSGDHRWMIAKCPFHDDHNPSFWIDSSRQICSCYSGCTPKPLDVINLYARLFGMSNRDAIFMLAKSL